MKTIMPRIAILAALLVAGTSIIFAREALTSPQDPTERYRVILKLISKQDYQQAAEECRALIESRPDFSRPYGKLVVIAIRSGQLDQVQSYFERLSGTNPRAFYSLGQIHKERKEYQAAFDYQIKCLSALPGFLPAAGALAQAALDLKKPGDAESFFRSRPTEAVFMLGLSRLYLLRQKYDSALELIEQALLLNPHLIDAKAEKVYIYYTVGRKDEALAICEALLPVVTESEDPEKRFYLLDHKAKINYERHVLAQTIDDLTEALRLAREYGLKISEDVYLSMIGKTYLRMNYFSKALIYYQQARDVSLAANRRDLSRYLGNIGLVYSSMRDFSKAAEFYQQAIDAARAARPPDNPSLINFLINLSGISPEIGRAEQARALLEEATRILGSSSDWSLTYRIQAGWASYYEHVRNFSESLKFNQAALQTAQENKDLIKEGACFYRIGDLHLRLKEDAAAITAYQQALAVGKQIQALAIIWKAEAGLARSRQQQQPEQALLHFRQAIEAIENIRGRQTTPEEKTGFFQNKTEVYEHAVLLLTSMHRRDPSKGYDAEAFHLAERARARALLDSLGETAAHLEQRLDRNLLDRKQEIQQRLSRVEAQIVKAAGDKTTPPQTLRKLEADLRQVVDDYTDWRQQVRLRDPRIAELTLPEPFTLEQVQASLR